MRKFVQWSLVTIVAIVLLAVVVGQMLATTTGRAREASVAVLKEKLARLEAERAAAAPVAIPEPAGVTPGAGADLSHATMDEDALRARWLALFETLEDMPETCVIAKDTWRAATGRLIDTNARALTEVERDELLQYQACVAPFKNELLALRDQHEDLGALFDLDYGRMYNDVLEGFWRCEWELRKHLWLDASLGDHSGTVDAFTSLVYLMKFDFSSSIAFWDAGQTTNWILLRPAIESGAVDDTRWERLLGLLETHRKQDFFFRQVERHTGKLLHGFENWKTLDRDLKFSEYPVTFLRTWAYPRITPALFNHDFDRFNRTMNELLDLARVPYFEAWPALEQFCEDFDVEPGIDEIKFVRGNPGWAYVLELSRGGIPANAGRQASMDLIRMAILLERHKHDTGSYPESLEALANELGGSVPTNPLMGEPYLYKRIEDMFRLGYSHDQSPILMQELGLGPVAATYWDNPLGSGLQDADAPAEEENAGE